MYVLTVPNFLIRLIKNQVRNALRVRKEYVMPLVFAFYLYTGDEMAIKRPKFVEGHSEVNLDEGYNFLLIEFKGIKKIHPSRIFSL